jgi:hypothetical protein
MTQPGPSIEDLASGELLLRLEHRNLAQQVRPYLGRLTLITAGYWLINGIAAGFALWLSSRQPEFSLGLSYICLGMVLGYLVLLPVHETIHALAYRALGYGTVSIQYEFRRLTAYCIADRQVVDAGRFAVVCLAPFSILNLFLVVAVAMASGVPQVLLAGALLLHIGACSGDIALVNLLWLNRDRRVFTYDDQSNAESRFIACE